ncbi:AmmeMemoRadiSam system protein B [Persephonella sp.]
MSITVREPAVSNAFYPGDPEELKRIINFYLEKAPLYNIKPDAVVSPHAGYIYSGEVAAISYKQFLNLNRDKHYDILLIGPSHYVPFSGVSFGYYDFWETPLGEVRVNKKIIEEFIYSNPDIPTTLNTLPHIKEHSLEVQVPFLQMVLEDFSIIPVVYGHIDYKAIKRVMEFIKGDKDNVVVVISSDLSHYYPDDIAKNIDKYCNLAVETLNPEFLNECEACGKVGLEAIINFAKEKGWKSKVLDYKTSGDTAGDRSAVVGYGSYIFYKGW